MKILDRLCSGSMLLLLLAGVVSAEPIVGHQQLTLDVGQELTLDLPLISALQIWKIINIDREILEIRSQLVEPDRYRLVVAGRTPGRGDLRLQLTYSVPTFAVLEDRTYAITVAGAVPPQPATPLADDTESIDTAPTPVAVTVPVLVPRPVPVETTEEEPVRVLPQRVERQPVYVIALGETADGWPRVEKLDVIKEWLAVADELRETQFYERALAEYAQAKKFQLPPEVAARLLMGEVECYRNLGEREEALDRLREVVSEYPETEYYPGARLLTGRLLMAERKYPEAIREFFYLSEEFGNSAVAREGRYYLGGSYFEMKRFTDALSEYIHLLPKENRPEWRSAVAYEIAKIYDYIPELRDYYKAIEYYRRVDSGEFRHDARERVKHIRDEYL